MVHHGVETLTDLLAPDESEERDAHDTETDDAAFSGSIEGADASEAAVSLHELGEVGDEPSTLAHLGAIDAQQDLLDRQRRELDRLREVIIPDR